MVTTQAPKSAQSEQTKKSVVELAQAIWDSYDIASPQIDLTSDVQKKLIWIARYLSRNDSLLKRYESRVHSKLLENINENPPEIRDIPHISIEDINPTSLPELLSCDFPVVIKGVYKDSAAVQQWSLDFLKTHYGQSLVPCVEYFFKDDDTEPYYNRHDLLETTLENAIEMMREGDRKYTVGCASLFDQHPQLLAQIDIGKIERSFDCEVVRPEFFIGSTQNLSYYHCAPAANIFNQIHGEKEWIFVAPWHGAWMYPNVGHRKSGVYFASPVITSQQAKDSSQYPLYEKIPKFRAKVSPGDILYNPPWWWHEVSNLSESIGVAMRVPSLGGLHSNGLLFNCLAFASPSVIEFLIAKTKSQILHPGKRFMDLDDSDLKKSLKR